MDFKDPKSQKLVLAGIAVAGLGYLYFFATFVPFGYRAMAAEKKELQGQYEQLSSDLNKARQTLSSMARVEREFEAIQRRYEAARVLLPEEKEVANLLRMVSLVGQQSGVEFELFKPLPQVQQGYYTENPVDVKVTGDYHDVGQFLAEVANLSRIVKVSQLNLVESKSEEDTRTVIASFTASAFTLNPNPPAAEVAEGDAPAGTEAAPAAAGSGRPERKSSAAAKATKAKAKETAHDS
jgi:type IV pilus assembly protein PilO